MTTHAEESMVLLADDDQSLRTATARLLEEAGFRCLEAVDGADALERYEEERPDLVILDVMMPKVDGFEVCERIRAKDKATPVLMLTAKGDIVDKRVGYRMGADDYLVKPFSGEELALRVGALLRRSRELAGERTPARRTVVVGDVEIDVVRGEALVAGEKVELTPKESRILAVLAEHPGEVFDRDDLVRAVWGEEYVGTQISIPVYIRKLREKLEDNPSEPVCIQTVWGMGYRLGEGGAGGSC
ncbi:response regulator transcription factor [Arabiibacter massiliensis]|uniref:response regulator transcription factor n=1 Tax=Arabiibacter massiliensis TaxID=1870985 RepID=UPI0018D5CE53|nr:response regulator transcription factor [Arabiibacter massiliensis]